MKVSREELLHIANLASLNLKEDEVDTYLLHLQRALFRRISRRKAPLRRVYEPRLWAFRCFQPQYPQVWRCLQSFQPFRFLRRSKPKNT